MKSFFKLLFFVLLITSLSEKAVGQCTTTTWLGGTSSDWGNAANWSDCVPTSSVDVTIPSGTVYTPILPVDETSKDVKSLTIDTGANLNMSYDSGSFNIYGDLLNNGTINHSGTVYIYLHGASNTIGGTGDFFGSSASPFNIAAGANYTLLNDINVRHFYVESTGEFDMNGYDITTEFFFQEGVLYLRAGNLNIWGGSDASMWYNPGDAINPYFSTDGNFNTGTGTVCYCQGDGQTANDQKIRSTTYYDLKVKTGSGNTATLGTGSAITVSNDLTFLNPGTAGGVATTANDVTVGNNLYIANTGNALTLNLANRMYRGTGTGTLAMGDLASNAINATYAHASNNIISGFGTPTFYGTFTYNSGSAQQVVGASYDNLIIDGAGTRTLAADITVNEDLTIDAGTLESTSSRGITLYGNWTNNGAFTPDGGMVTFDGSGVSDLAKTSADASVELLNEDFENGGSVPTGWTHNDYVTNSLNWTFQTGAGGAGSVTTANGGTYNANFYGGSATDQKTRLVTPVIDFTGNTTSPTLTFWHAQEAWLGDQNILRVYYKTSAGGTWTLLESYVSSVAGWTQRTISLPNVNSTYYIAFQGENNYGYGVVVDDVVVKGAPDVSSETFYDLTINKTSGATVDLASIASVSNSLTFTSGNINATADYYPEFGVSATVAGTPAASTHINGPVKKSTNSTTAFKFPVGDGTAYRPIQITPDGATATTWTAKYNNTAHAETGVAAPLELVSDTEYWDLDRDGAVNGKITLWWDENSNITTENLVELYVSHFNSVDNKWEEAGSLDHAGNSSAGSVSSYGTWSDFSPFTIGSSNAEALPVTMTQFSINCQDESSTTLTWQTESEINSNYFDVEKSIDGDSWEVVGTVQGQGNSNSVHDYNWSDYQPYKRGVSYYRLRQVDFDGEYEVFGPLSSNCLSKQNNKVEVYPNPTIGNVTISYSWFNSEKEATLKLTDAMGRLVKDQPITLVKGMNYYGLDLSNQTKGVYFINIEIAGERVNLTRVVKQ